MTVWELKVLIADLEDDMRVVIYNEETYWEVNENDSLVIPETHETHVEFIVGLCMAKDEPITRPYRATDNEIIPN